MKRYSTTYAGDPRQITAKFTSTCAQCHCQIKKGDDIYYWPNSQKAYCSVCGEPDYRQFLSSKADEDTFHGVGNPY